MNLLADQSFPDYVRLIALPELRIWRWSSEGLSDFELLETAAPDFSGVVFLGTAQLYSAELRERAKELGLTLIGTSETDPIAAATALGLNVHALSRQISSEASVVVYAREVRPFHM